MYCEKCGRQLPDGMLVCPNCSATQSVAYTPPPAQQPYYQASGTINSIEDVPYNFRPLTAWAFFGYGLLFSIPLVGFIMLLVYSFGGTPRVCLQNYARSYFCGLIIGIVLGAILVFLGVLTMPFISDETYMWDDAGGIASLSIAQLF